MATGQTLDELVVRIKADTKNLNAALGKLKGDLGGVSKTAKGAGAGTGAAFSGMRAKALGVIAAVTGITVAINKVAQAGMVFEDLKDSLDIVFGGAAQGDQALAKITQFAQTTPFQIDDVTKAFIGLKSAGIEPTVKMLQTFADTASIATDQKGTFEALITFFQRSAAGGASLVELNRINDRGIDIFSRLEKEIGKSRTELSTFGQTAEGSKIIQEGLLKVLERDFGGAMAAKMDNLSTKASNMQIAFKVLGDEIFKSGLGDMLKAMADDMTEIANQIARALRDFRNERTLSDFGISEQVKTGETLQLATGQVIELTRAKTNEELLAEVQARLDELGGTEQGAILRGQMAQYELATSGLSPLLVSDQEEMKKINEKISSHDDFLELKKLELDLEERINLELQRKADLSAKGQSGATTEQISNLTKMNKILEDSRPAAEKLAETVEMIEGFRGVVNKDDVLFFTDEEIDRMKEFVQLDVPEELKEVATMSEHMQNAIASAANAFTTDFVSALIDGQDAMDAFDDFAKKLVSSIIATFMQLAVVNTILNSIFGAGTFDQLTFGEDGMKIKKAKRQDASGGAAFVGQATLVGERGPELFVPHSNGVIMNGMNTKNALGGGPPVVVNQSINFATGVVPTVRAEVQNMLPQIADVAKGAVLEASQRGGAYRRGLMGG